MKREAERFSKAEKVSDCDGWIFWDGTGHNDGFFPSVEELLEHLEGEEMVPPPYVWTCKRIPFVANIFDRTIDCIADNAYDDWEISSLSGVKEFKEAVDAFETANTHQVSWEPDYTVALLLA